MVNTRVQKHLLPPILYSYTLCRCIHHIISTRLRHPTTKIIICKVDINAAFRRCTLASNTATESLTIIDGLLLMALRMTFGGSPCPALWGIISITLADLSNTIIQNKDWDHTVLYDEISDSLAPPLSLPDSIPFHLAKQLALLPPMNDKGQVDICIDNSIGITPDIKDNHCRICRTIPLAIRVLGRPLDPSDIIPQKEIISRKKYATEGCMEEQKTLLGWIINSRSLTITLPSHKHCNWRNEIQRISSSQR
jgi:hypothetical protein